MSLLDNVTNEYSIEVDLIGVELDPEKISAILGVTPSKAARAGDPRKNGQEDAVHEHGFWTQTVSNQDDITECRDHQLQLLADSIEPHLESLRGAGVERIYFYYTLCSQIGMMNIHFNANTLAKLNRLGADLYVSCYDCFNPNDPIWKDDSSKEASLDQAEASSAS